MKLAFPSIKPLIKPEVPKISLIPTNLNIKNWIAGLEEGCFYIEASKFKTYKTGIRVVLNFNIVQNIRDSYLLTSFVQVFGCSFVSFVKKYRIVRFTVKFFSDITEKIIPFFEKYNI